MNRHQARELAFSLIFEREFDKTRTPDELYDLAKETRAVEESGYVRSVLRGVAEKEEEIETFIAESAVGWSVKRISKISLSILKLSVYEMLYCQEVPIRVSLNEAIELVKSYDEEGAKAFVNGILNTVSKKAAALRTEE